MVDQRHWDAGTGMEGVDAETAGTGVDAFVEVDAAAINGDAGDAERCWPQASVAQRA